ncbi:MAG: HYC_CC_PP family protein [Arcticibacter sp.]
MKKLIVAILAVFYLGVSSGATMHFHHCMGQLVEWGFSSTKSDESSKCSRCGMKTGDSDDCCKHQAKEVKVDKVQKVAENHYQFKVFVISLRSSALCVALQPYFQVTEAHPLLNSPPGISDVDKYLQVCSFRI